MTSLLRIGSKRIYDTASTDDGLRVLVDRIWPRGMTRDAAKIHHWAKELGPSHELRKWFGHRIERWDLFQEKYMEELNAPQSQELLEDLVHKAANFECLTLLYSTQDPTHNQAVVLASVLSKRITL